MKNSIAVTIHLIGAITILTSCNNNTSITLAGSWDDRGFTTTVIDSNAIPPKDSAYTINYNFHAQRSYQFMANDSFVFTDYTVLPNNVIHGSYQLINCNSTSPEGIIVLFFPTATPDTLNFKDYILGGKGGFGLNLTSTLNIAHITTETTQIYEGYN